MEEQCISHEIISMGNQKACSENVVLLKLYKAVLDGDNWTNVEELPFNSNNYSVANPTLNPAEDRLYFSSDIQEVLVALISGMSIFSLKMSTLSQ